MDQWLNPLTQWLGLHSQYVAVAILVTSFSECLALIGLLIPGTLLLFALGTLAGSSGLGASETVLLGFIGGLLGDLTSYELGHRYHQKIRLLPILRSRPEWLALAEQYVQRYGVVSLLVGRFIGTVRPFLPMTAGMLDMPFRRFLLISLPASLSWAAVYLLPGWITGAALRIALPEHFWYEALWVTGGLTLLLGGIFYGSLRRLPAMPFWSAGLCLLALFALSLGWPQLHALDQGLMTLLQQARSPALDQFMVFITQLGDSSIHLYLGLVVVGLLLLNKHRPQAQFVVITLLGTAALNTVLKHTVSRERPDILLEPFRSYSYPSAHSSAAFAFCLALGVLAGAQKVLRIQLAWLLLAALPAVMIASSRLYLGAHWPSDVLAGALVAATAGAGALGLIQKFKGPSAALPPYSWWLVSILCLGVLAIYAYAGYPDALARYQYH